MAEVDRTGGVLLVAVAGCSGLVIGWCCGLLAEEEAELLRIAVTPLKRECGVASALLSAFESECRDKKVAVIFLEVADMNCPARRLYAKFAYQQVGKRKDYYRQPPDDALVMNKRLQV